MLQRGGWVTGNDLNDPYWGDRECRDLIGVWLVHEPGESSELMNQVADLQRERRIRRWEDENGR